MSELTPEQAATELLKNLQWLMSSGRITSTVSPKDAERMVAYLYGQFTDQQTKTDALTAENFALVASRTDARRVTEETLLKCAKLEAERDAARAELQAAQEQKPVGCAYVESIKRLKLQDTQAALYPLADCDVGMIVLYAAPVPAQPVTREGCNYLAMQGTVCNKCGEVHK
jgi:hypothetical protein